ncbi:hypothetical protein ACES2L_01735 [Bdellovibrio bacteriovorus]
MKKKLLITTILLLVFFAGSHLLIANSKGVQVATKYLQDSSEVEKLVGEVSEVNLIPLATALNDYGSEGRATYHLIIVGVNRMAEGVVTSTKIDGQWKIEKVQIIFENKDIVILKHNSLH